MKIAHHNKQDKSLALNNLLAGYRATPHSSTGIAPGDILFRHGYNKDFPQTQEMSDTQIREALNTDQGTREARDEVLNRNRVEDSIKIGDKVLTRNFQKTKFQPTFGPQKRQVTSIKNGAFTCTSEEDGSVQLRHGDDVKLTKEDQNKWWTFDIREEEEALRQEEEEALPQEEEVLPSTSQNITTGRTRRPLPPPREKSTRARNPPPNLADYATDY